MKRIVMILLVCFLGTATESRGQDEGEETPRPTAAVLDFNVLSGINKQEAKALTNKFQVSLSKTEQYELLERSDMEEILKEQDFSMTDQCNSAECAVEVGKLLAAEKIITGDIGKIGETYTITVKVVDVSSGKIEITDSEEYRGEADGLIGAFDRIAQKVTGTYSSGKKWWYIGGAAAALGGGAAILLLGGNGGGDGSTINPPGFPDNTN